MTHRKPEPGERVFVYRNLHKRMWSVKSAETNRLLCHCSNLILKQCQFKVSEAGRQRVIRERRKNVHAGIYGHWCEDISVLAVRNRGWDEVTYDPYSKEGFTRVEDGSRIESAPYTVFMTNTVYASREKPYPWENAA
jgi:hypothetical protein